MTESDLPPYLRESDVNRKAPPQELPLELPDAAAEVPMPAPAEKDERPVDPFMRRS